MDYKMGDTIYCVRRHVNIAAKKLYKVDDEGNTWSRYAEERFVWRLEEGKVVGIEVISIEGDPSPFGWEEEDFNELGLKIQYAVDFTDGYADADVFSPDEMLGEADHIPYRRLFQDKDKALAYLQEMKSKNADV